MKILNSNNITKELQSRQIVITVGTFDGIHVGHQSILTKMYDISSEKNMPSLLFTFAQHPRNVLYRDEKPLQVLTTNREKIHFLSQFKFRPNYLYFQTFTPEFAALSPEQFIRDILYSLFHAVVIVVGHDHAFGKNREGNLELLESICKELNVHLIQVNPVEVDNLVVSSSKIRKLLLEGNIRLANRLLGYPYTVIGTVIHGDHLGSKLGFPTANVAIDPTEKLLPPNGVYVATIEVEHSTYPAMVNIGTRPTFNGNNLRLEAHLLNTTQNLYGKELIIKIHDRLREEKKFSSIEELISQLHQDKAKAQAILANQLK